MLPYCFLHLLLFTKYFKYIILYLVQLEFSSQFYSYRGNKNHTEKSLCSRDLRKELPVYLQ